MLLNGMEFNLNKKLNMWKLDTLWSDINDILKSSEQVAEDFLWKEINILTESKSDLEKRNQTELEQRQAAVTEQARMDTLNLEKDVVKTSVLNQLKTWFDDFVNKINWLSVLSDNDKIEYINIAQKEYDGIKKTIESYKNDWEFKQWFAVVEWKITKWVWVLKEKQAHPIRDSAIHSLNLLRTDLWVLNWVSKESIEQSKAQLTEKYEKETSWDKEATSMLTNIGIPAWLAGTLVMFWKKFWLFWESNWEKWLFSKFIDFLKNPIKWFMSLLGFEDKKSTQLVDSDTKKTKITKTQETDNEKELITANSKLSDTQNWQKYSHEKITMETNHWNLSEVLIWNIKYELNINNQPDMFMSDISFEKRNTWDILKIWDEKIPLLKLIQWIDSNNPKEYYTIKEDFRLMWDLVLEKVT